MFSTNDARKIGQSIKRNTLLIHATIQLNLKMAILREKKSFKKKKKKKSPYYIIPVIYYSRKCKLIRRDREQKVVTWQWEREREMNDKGA